MPIIKQICNVDNTENTIEDDISSLISTKKLKANEENCSVPLYRTSRGGCVQVLPTRFNDSIIETTIINTLNPKLNDKGISVYSRKRSKSAAKSAAKSSLNKLKFGEAEIGRNGEKAGGKKEGFYKSGDFILGDVLWAKSGKRCPTWPGIVIDPKSQAPDSVLRACVLEATCVMYFGYAKNGNCWNLGNADYQAISNADKSESTIEYHTSSLLGTKKQKVVIYYSQSNNVRLTFSPHSLTFR